METPAKTALGGSLISALALGGMVVVGVTAGVVADPGAPPARAATGLTTFQDCASLQRWYVDHTLDQVGPYGWAGRIWPERMPGYATALGEDTAVAQDGGVANGPTGTNTQESGVDEPDVAKTDGRLVVQLTDSRRVVITDVAGPAPRRLADWRLPDASRADGLLLVGHHVIVSSGRVVAMAGGARDSKMIAPGGGGGSELVDLDISDPAHPVLDSRTSWTGSVLSLRQYDDTVRLVTSTGRPELPFVHPERGRLTPKQALRRNREIVRNSNVGGWLPAVDSNPVVGCSDVYHPTTWPRSETGADTGPDTVAVATFRPGAVDRATAVAVTGAGGEVYSSTDRLYVTSADWGRPRAQLHAFALEGDRTAYVASGSVAGEIRDRWSLDEHDGHLRVAVSWPDRLGHTRDNGIVVLDERDGRLEQVGELRGLGVDEEIQSVRWFDDLAVLVTFRQMDPLYTIDLADPTRPRRLGELKIPGFSAYLHPIGDGLLLGLGTDATTAGQSRGAQAGVFDLADPARTQQVGKVTFGRDSALGAGDDPHAFTWLPAPRVAITALQHWEAGPFASEMVLLRVSTSGAVTTEPLPSPGGSQPRALPLEDGRIALVGDRVEVVRVT